MTKRVLPEPDKYASCPGDEKILQYYKDQFDSVYILLHPFIKTNQIDLESFCPSRWPSKHDLIKGCEPLTWNKILSITGLKNIAEIDVGLRTRIHGIKEKFANEEFANRLSDLFDENIICPPEGDISPLLENKIFSAIKKSGHEWLWVADEFGTERKLTWIDDLVEKDLVPSHGCVFTHDHSLLITTHWDSHCSFLCSSKDIIEKILSVNNFEGFYCSPKTEVYWGLYEV